MLRSRSRSRFGPFVRSLRRNSSILLSFLLLISFFCINSDRQLTDRDESLTFLPLMTPATQTSSALDRPLRLLTFNIRHAEGSDGRVDLARIAQVLDETQADIIALQEVDRYWTRSGNTDQVQALAHYLRMEWRFSPSLELGKRQYGNAILSKFPIEGSETVLLRGGKETRSMLETSILIGERTIRVVTTHLGVGNAERIPQMKVLLNRVSSYSGPTVLMGDWNMLSNDRLLAPLESQWFRLPLPQEASTLQTGGQIDHIYVNFDGGGFPAWTESTIASDHLPVLALIEQRQATIDRAQRDIAFSGEVDYVKLN